MGSDDRKYNGWTNYETWCVNLWMDNDAGISEYWREAAIEAWEDARPKFSLTRKEDAVRILADRIKEETTDAMPDLGCSMFADMLGAAFDEVNWHEIAEHMVDDMDEDDMEEEEDEDDTDDILEDEDD